MGYGGTILIPRSPHGKPLLLHFIIIIVVVVIVAICRNPGIF
jgi:hypothetical protein